MPRFLSPYEWLTLHTAVVVLALVSYAAISLARRQRRHPSAAIAWVLFLALMPYVAMPLFLVFGSRKTVRAPAALRRSVEETIRGMEGPGARMRALALGLGLPSAAPCEDLVVHDDGAAAFERLQAIILGAQHTLDIATFLVGRDALGERLAALLQQRAREGVRVRLMIDGVGRYLGGIPDIDSVGRAGVHVALFVRPWSSALRGRVNLRNHRKMIVADGQWLWSGGRNLAAEYFAGVPSLGHEGPAWIDLSFDLRGPVAGQAQEQFERDWAIANRSQRAPVPFLPPASSEPPAGALAQLLPSGPDQAHDTIYELMIDACFSARRRILALTPYFVPDPALVMAFALAARRGVAVDLVLPRHSNHRLADLARPPALRELLDAGVRVWLADSMMHAKLMVVDDTVALAGSLNLDSRSLFLNYEMMVAFYDAEAIDRFARWGEGVRANARAMQRQRVSAAREVGEGLLRWLTFQL